MIQKILISLVVFLVGIAAVALLKSPDFRVERSITVAAAPADLSLKKASLRCRSSPPRRSKI